MKHHPPHGHLRIQELLQMPTDAFPFPVFIRGQQELVSALESVLEFLHHLFLILRHHIQGFEVVGRVDAEIGPLFRLVGGWNFAGVVGEIAHVAHGGLHPEVLGQKSPDGAGLGGALDDHQGVRHRRWIRPVDPLYRIGAPFGATFRETAAGGRRLNPTSAPLQSASTPDPSLWLPTSVCS